MLKIKKVVLRWQWGPVYTLDKMFGFLLIHHLTVITPCPLNCEMGRPSLITNVFSTPLPEVYLIYPWLPGEKCKPIIICDADKALYFVFHGTIYYLTIVKKRFILLNAQPI